MEDVRLQFTVENIENVLHQFYNDVHSQAQANQYLMLAQLSPEAWNFAWLLLNPSKPNEAQFFGASTLQTKISKHWCEVPGDQYEALRTKLLQAVVSYAGGPKVILTRLCVALSSFVIQTITNFWPTAVADLMSALQPHNVPNVNEHQVTHVLLEVLMVLCEELHTSNLSQSKSHAVRHALQSSFQAVMSLIESVLSKNSAPMDVCEMALKCYSSWSQLGSAALEYEPLLVLAFDAVYREELYQTALETLSNIATHPVAHKYPNVILKMVDNIAKFDNLLMEATRDRDMEKCCNMYAFILAVAETHTTLLLETIIQKPEKQEGIMKVVKFILQCSGAPGQYPIDEMCSELPFTFWYTLQDGIVSSEARVFEKYLLLFHPIFQSLLDTYIVKLRYPSEDAYQQWSADEQESFRCYRQDIGDSIMYCYSVLRHSALANLITHLQVATAAATGDGCQWQYLEACLFAFKEIAQSIDLKEQCYIPQFMAHLPNIPLNNLKVISAVMDALGAYAEWINAHPDVLCFVVPLLLMGLQNADVAPSATFALKDITRDCHVSLQPYAEQILLTSQEAMKGRELKPREKVRLMCTVGHVLSIMPYSYIMSYLNSLLTPMIDNLNELVNETNTKNRPIIVHHLHMLSMLFVSLDLKVNNDGSGDEASNASKAKDKSSELVQPVYLILEKVMPIFSTLGTNWESNEQITEALCEALKKAVSTLLDDCKPFVPDIIRLMLHLYKQCPHPSVLDMAKQILLLFAPDEDQRPHLSSFFAEICNHTILLTQTDFHESTAVLDIFLQLLTQIMKKAFLFYKNDTLNLPVVFQCGIAALGLPEKQTVKSAASFITEFITRSREAPNMSDVVNGQGEMLVVQIMKVIGGESPRSVVEFMPDILIALNKKYFDNLCRWMSSFSQDDSFLPAVVTRQQREQFTRLVLKERTNKRKLKETVNEFSLLCRGLIGTEYAAQSTSAP